MVPRVPPFRGDRQVARLRLHRGNRGPCTLAVSVAVRFQGGGRLGEHLVDAVAAGPNDSVRGQIADYVRRFSKARSPSTGRRRGRGYTGSRTLQWPSESELRTAYFIRVISVSTLRVGSFLVRTALARVDAPLAERFRYNPTLRGETCPRRPPTRQQAPRPAARQQAPRRRRPPSGARPQCVTPSPRPRTASRRAGSTSWSCSSPAFSSQLRRCRQPRPGQGLVHRRHRRRGLRGEPWAGQAGHP